MIKLKRGNIIAHRGWWLRGDEKNTIEAIDRAFSSGFGVETDFRDKISEVVISHDPADESAYSAREIFEIYMKRRSSSRIAMNVKSDGLQNGLLSIMSESHVPLRNVYAFDMSVPDSLGYLKLGIPFYTRISEYEGNPALLESAAGVWVDSFTGEFPQVAKAQELIASNHRVCLVSPELHKRDHHELWQEISRVGLHRNPLFEICTDIPQVALEFFGESE